jgi:2-(3-amino-3-carboxypropyl)histidine synthase
MVLFLSEIMPDKLARFKQVDAWVQIACPRLSIDWGHYYAKPLLSTYEVFALLSEAQMPSPSERYPMDYYSDQGGQWSNYWKRNQLSKKAAAAK